MSRLTELQTEWRRIGEERRKTFTPRADGTPLKIFHWWENETGDIRRPINLCHYFWVVVLWAPLLKLRLTAKREYETREGKIALGVLAAAIFVTLCIVFESVLKMTILTAVSVAGGLYAVGAFKLSMCAVDDVMDHEAGPHWYRQIKHYPVLWVLLLALSAPILIALLMFGAILLIFDSQWASNVWSWYARRPCFNTNITLLGFTGLLILVGFEVWMMLIGVWMVPISTGLAAVLFGTAVLIGEVVDYVKAKRKPALERRQRRELEETARGIASRVEPALRILFEFNHPKKAGDREAFLKWKERYFQHTIEIFGPRVWMNSYECGVLPGVIGYGVKAHAIKDLIGDAIDEIKSSERSQVAELPVLPKPGITVFRTTGSLIAQFAALAWQMFLALKWQMCPWVEVDSPDTT